MFNVNEYYFPQSGKLTFVVIGCGGTGSYVVRDLARLVSVINQQNQYEYDILLYDADIIEPKNLARQNFVTQDLGKNKAEVLADRYSISFGVNISYVPKYFSMGDTIIQDLVSQSDVVFIGCVDNNASRVEIDKMYKTYSGKNWGNRKVAYIDAGRLSLPA